MTKMPPELAQAGRINYRRQAEIARETANVTQAVWRQMPKTNFTDKVDWYNTIGAPAIAATVVAQQNKALAVTEDYMAVTGAIQGVEDQSTFNPSAIAYEPEALEDALGLYMYQYMNTAMVLNSDLVAHRRIGYYLTSAVASAVQDATRDATSAVMVTSGYYSYVRVLQTPSCSRCVVMAGREYKTQTVFLRHENCDCQTLPLAEKYDDVAIDPLEAIKKGQVTGLSKADTEAIVEHGADVSQVINAKSGMTKTSLLGQKVQATTVGTSSRGLAGQRLGDLKKQSGSRYRTTQNTRLSVGQILTFAEGDKTKAAQMLYRHGYIY